LSPRSVQADELLKAILRGFFKTEAIRLKGAWRHLEAVEFATLDWVDWFNHRRLLEPIGDMPHRCGLTKRRPPGPVGPLVVKT